jgi:hypothetical protein
MLGEFPVNLHRPPIGRLPYLEGIPKLPALLAADVKDGTVAAGIEPDIPFLIDAESMMAREVMQPAAIHLEVSGSSS